jgi:uncharacterized membrane protein YfcA
MEQLVLVALGAAAGLLIGCVGIGGVIVVPALVYLAGESFQTAIAAALCAFIVSGIVGAYAYAKAGSIRWRATAWTWVGALPCALAGALLLSRVMPTLLELAIGLLAAGSWLHALASRRDTPKPSPERAPSAPSLTAIGAVTGFLSALTGTGGPLVLMPILLSLQAPVLVSLGLAQAIQLPIAAAATAGNLFTGVLDVRLGSTLAGGIALGTWIGAKAAHALPTELLRKAVAVLLILVGALMLLRLATS